MYPFIGNPLNFGAARFLNGYQPSGNQMFANQSAPIIPRTFNVPQQPRVMPTQAPVAPMQPQGLLSPRAPFRGQGGRDGAAGPGRGGGFGGGQRGPAGLGPNVNRGRPSGPGIGPGMNRGRGPSGGGFGGGGRY